MLLAMPSRSRSHREPSSRSRSRRAGAPAEQLSRAASGLNGLSRGHAEAIQRLASRQRVRHEVPRRRGPSGRLYQGRVFGVMDVDHALRSQFISLVEHPWFNYAVLVLIITNSATMALQDPLATKTPDWSSVCEWVFTIIFSAEAVCRVLAEGLLFDSKTAYLTEVWNWIDFLTVVFSWISLLLPDAGNLSAMRSIRVLKPLRTVRRVPGLRVLIGALVHSLPALGDVARLFAFLLVAFGVISVELFAGAFHYRCYDTSNAAAEPWGSCVCAYATGADVANGTAICGSLCPSGFECRYSAENPNAGATSFDHIFSAIANIFQAMTLEGWTDTLYLAEVYHPVAAPIFFIIVCFLGGVFVVNLFLVVMSDSYFDIQKEIKQEKHQMEELAKESERLSLPEPSSFKERESSKLRQRALRMPERMWGLLQGAVEAGLERIRVVVIRLFPGQEALKPLISHHFFEVVMVTLILLNTVVMALDFYGDAKNATFDDALKYLNYVFTIAFLLEMLLKLVAMGAAAYFSIVFNIFDALVVVVSVIEILISESGSSANMNLSSLRALRLLRAFKLMRQFKGLRKMISTLGASLSQTKDLAAVLLLMIFIFALLGSELFAGQIGDCIDTGQLSTLTTDSAVDPIVVVETGSNATALAACLATSPLYEWRSPPENFDSLGDALFTMYVIFVGENWNDGWHATYVRNGWLSTIFYVFALMVGQFILLNLFLGILLSNFDFDGASDQADEIVAQGESPSPEATPTKKRRSARTLRYNSDLKSYDDESYADGEQEPSLLLRHARALEILHTRILWGVGNARWRQRLLQFIWHPRFEVVVIVAIMVSSISLALDNPRANLVNGFWETDPELSNVLAVIDFVCTVFFTLEALTKIFALGLYAGRFSYLIDNWNKLDVFVVCISWVSIILSKLNVSSGGVRALRAMRVLRPIRMVNRIPSMRIVVNSIFLAIPGVANVAALLGFFLLIFAILGVQFFGGRLAQCEVAAATNRSACDATFTQLVDGRSEQAINRTAIWYNPDMGNFDDVLSAMLILFEMITGEMWPDVLHLQIDAYAVYEAPRSRSSLWLGRLYCFLWTFLGTLLIGNLFIGVLIDNFDKLRADERGRGSLTTQQMHWVAVQQLVIKTKAVRRPPRPSDGQQLRLRAYDFVMSSFFENSITVLIIANTLALAIPHFQEAPWITDMCDCLNFAFTTIWLTEAVLKIYSFSWKAYISFGWNRFDGSLVVLGITDDIITILLRAGAISYSGSLDNVSSAFRLARLLRLVRVVQNVRSLRSLLHTLILSLPSLASIAALELLLLFMYAVLGVQLFYNVRHGNFLTENANFETIGSALLLLFRCSTGESWNGIMHDLSIQEDGHELLSGPLGTAPKLPRCSEHGLSGVGESDCGSWIAVPFFITFTLIGYCVLVQALVAVLLGHFSNSAEEFPISRSCFEDFVYEWSKFDPSASLQMQATHFATLLRHLDYPLGVKDPTKRDSKHPVIMEGTSVLKVMAALHQGRSKLCVHSGQYLVFYEALMSLATRSFGLPKEGLGTSRFAQAHRNSIRRFMRKHRTHRVEKYRTSPSKAFPPQKSTSVQQTNCSSKDTETSYSPLRKRLSQMSNTVKQGSFSSKKFSSKQLRPGMKLLEQTTVLDVYFATLLQAAAQGYRARRELKGRREEIRQLKATSGQTCHGMCQRNKGYSHETLVVASTMRELEHAALACDDVAVEPAGDLSQFVVRQMPQAALIMMRDMNDESMVAFANGDRRADGSQDPMQEQRPSGPPMMGFFVAMEGQRRCSRSASFLWVPCWDMASESMSSETVTVAYTRAAVCGQEFSDSEIVRDPWVVLRTVRTARTHSPVITATFKAHVRELGVPRSPLSNCGACSAPSRVRASEPNMLSARGQPLAQHERRRSRATLHPCRPEQCRMGATEASTCTKEHDNTCSSSCKKNHHFRGDGTNGDQVCQIASSSCRALTMPVQPMQHSPHGAQPYPYESEFEA